jgi:riboflavin kinase/FMN adenylyltransferase
MAVHRISYGERPPAGCQEGGVTIGNFDGVHRGHASLLQEVRKQAALVGGPAVAVTFDPHPLHLLRPEQFQPVLTTIADRADLLQSAGADQIVILQTSPELLHLSAREFFCQVVAEGLKPKALAEGPNFGFGRGREGTVETLAHFCRESGLSLTVVAPVLFHGKPISSSRVRDALLRGEVTEARELLNRPYRMRGRVTMGQKRGRSLGFPTANLTAIKTVVAGNGVYAARVDYGGRIWAGAVNIGPNPTFGETSRKVEVHLIDFQGDLMDRELAIDFIARLRDTKRFPAVEQLVEQLRRDMEQVRGLVALS